MRHPSASPRLSARIGAACAATKRFVRSPLARSMLKATVANTSIIALVFVNPWSNLNHHPGAALNSAVLVVVAGLPGKTLGGCTDNLRLGGAGLAYGIVGYCLLAALCKLEINSFD